MKQKKLEQKANESLLGFEFVENSHRIRIIYQGNLELLRQGIYEIFIGLYNSLRGERK
jgi:hypothetical protein